MRSSKSDNGETIKKYFASIPCTLFTRLIDDSSPHSLAMVSSTSLSSHFLDFLVSIVYARRLRDAALMLCT